MKRFNLTVRVVGLAVVTLVGAGACTPDPQTDPGGRGGGLARAGSVEQATGAGGSSGSDRRVQAVDRAVPPRTITRPVPEPGPTRTMPQRPQTKPSQATSCAQGEYQREVETYLAKLNFGPVLEDGRQSDLDCATIKKFQQRYDIRPAEGRAGPLTYDVSKRLATTDVSRCNAGTGSATTFCIDLTRQTTWAMRSGKVVWGPTVTRTGMPGYRTPAGTFKINYRNIKEWSNPYEVWLPYWQHFTQGMGYHQTTTYLHNKSIGSHGCINLLPSDARRAWELGKIGSRVIVFGRRPGT
ncbi:L,D-transpeptidase family protein [Micromonospora olivasterospora]|uniref:L,D-transpeptidase-like protein n=1 Tax=Micromonospora olivasterospora TaxID=1880 RepID=A0A562IAI7_MICOL|nr:L,D-transpeptidase [Micromonospora olivasterospora]TWH68001.1 L,D-transpeptidase-like protein [Micromonospora olivasterospora]